MAAASRPLLNVSERGGYTVVRLAPRDLTGETTVTAVREQLLQLVEQGKRRLLLDMEEVSWLGNALLGAFISLMRRLVDADGHLAFCRLHAPIDEIFRVTRLDHVLDVRRLPPDEPVTFPTGAEAGFLEAVRETPEDDTPRLVYADWLEDNAQPERAEFIRAACAEVRLQGQPREELAARVQALRQRHEQDWARPLAGLVSDWEFRRGLVEEVTLSGAAFVDRADDLFRLAPLRRARLRCWGCLAALVRCPALARLERAAIWGLAVDDQRARALLESPYLDRAELSLGAGRLDRASRQALSDRFGARLRFR
jgi:anti-anti-sigma factor